MKPGLLLLAAALCAPSPAARPETLHALVGYECQPGRDRIVIRYRGALEEAGAALVKSKGENEWDPWQLVTVEHDAHRAFITAVRQVALSCRLSDGDYAVTVRPRPGNRNLLGRCGLYMNAGVRVSRGAKLLVDTDFQSDCDAIAPVITEIVVSPGAAPAITRVAWDDFYK